MSSIKRMDKRQPAQRNPLPHYTKWQLTWFPFSLNLPGPSPTSSWWLTSQSHLKSLTFWITWQATSSVATYSDFSPIPEKKISCPFQVNSLMCAQHTHFHLPQEAALTNLSRSLLHHQCLLVTRSLLLACKYAFSSPIFKEKALCGLCFPFKLPLLFLCSLWEKCSLKLLMMLVFFTFWFLLGPPQLSEWIFLCHPTQTKPLVHQFSVASHRLLPGH